jgi:DNA ligase-4
LDSIYQPAEREKSGWVKLKVDLIDGLGDTLDLIILGGYFGSGSRRSGDVSHFLLGIAEDITEGSLPTKFYGFCKVGSGYSSTELAELRERLRPHWKKYNPNYAYQHLFEYTMWYFLGLISMIDGNL